MGSCLLKSNPGLCGSVQSTLIWVPLVNSSHCTVFALLFPSVLGLVTRPNTSAAFAVLESATQYHTAVLFCDWAQRCSYQPIGYLVVCCSQPICVAPFRVWHHTQWPRMHNIRAQTATFAHNPIPSVLSGRRVGVGLVRVGQQREGCLAGSACFQWLVGLPGVCLAGTQWAMLYPAMGLFSALSSVSPAPCLFTPRLVAPERICGWLVGHQPGRLLPLAVVC